MTFDLEQFEEKKLRFLEALYEIVHEHMAQAAEANDPTLVFEMEQIIGARAGLTKRESDRIGTELMREQLVDAEGVPDGPNLSLTPLGLKIIERHRYERQKAARAKAVSTAKGDEFSVADVEASHGEFRELADDLMQADHSTWDNDLDRFIEHCENDPIIQTAISDLESNPAVDLDRWLADFEASGDSMIGSKRYKLPKDHTLQGALIYQLLLRIQAGESDVLNFACNAYGTTDFDDCVDKFNAKLTKKLIALIDERMNRLMSSRRQRTTSGTPSSAGRKRVFVVHGHDEGAKEAAARYIERLGMTAVILHEESNQGRTIIEKLETHAEVDFAVVLLTPDDVGASKQAHLAGGPLKDRPRQNVVFELGLFVGALKRAKVCALVKGDVELPSDIHGLVYIPMDDHGAWRSRLVKEFQAAGLEFDASKAI